ncbi:type II toxin-antitoxin system RelE family toxin [Streptococcus sobrinus]|uniref:type II toxin-antitoxin system RelE family toxin n=1 Tax=Streptococcus sobrinus TaxID=1310 RepID=UPI0002E4616E|nr:type II toxin-antitoxin system RelE/ParE family toxin [Streptococcus sobrinus]AWN18008.1 type II toxin-antitoxin system RelE/ParE family toxin [Streptococcus sobrinus]
MYRLVLSKQFIKQIKKFDKYTANSILVWLEKNIDGSDNPRQHGKALVGNLKGLWRYRIGNYRVVCRIQDEELVVVAVSGGHRRDIYKR